MTDKDSGPKLVLEYMEDSEEKDDQIHHTFEPKFLWRRGEDATDWRCHEIEVSQELHDADHAFLVVVRYTSGSSYGPSFGNWTIVGLYPRFVEAKTVQKGIENGGSGGLPFKTWTGYFENLERVDIHAMAIYS